MKKEKDDIDPETRVEMALLAHKVTELLISYNEQMKCVSMKVNKSHFEVINYSKTDRTVWTLARTSGFKGSLRKKLLVFKASSIHEVVDRALKYAIYLDYSWCTYTED